MKIECAEIILKSLVAYYVPSYSWKWDNSYRRFGCCRSIQKQISISRKLTELNSEEQFIDTVLHEVAHALSPLYEGHGTIWKETAESIGSNPVRCYSSDVVKPKPKYRGECPHCFRIIYKYRRRKIACGKCCREHNNGEFDSDYLIRWYK